MKRGRIAAATTAAALVACVASCAPSSPSRQAPALSGSWTMYQGTPDRNAVLPGELEAEWKTDVGERTNGGLAVAGGRVFVDTFGQKVLALDLHSGSVLWQTALDNVAMSTPIVAQGLVFIGTGKNEMGNTRLWSRAQGDSFEAFDARTGALKWKFVTHGEDMPSPAFAGGELIFANGDAHVYALQASAGKLLWKRSVPGIATMASANVLEGNAIVSICTQRFLGGMTLALDAKTGAVRWRAPFGNCDSSPAVGGGRIYVSGIDGLVQDFGFGGRGYVAALDARTGKLVWRYQSPRVGFDVAAGSAERAVAGTYHDGELYQSIPDEDELFAFNAVTGTPRWTIRTLAPVKMSPVIVRDRILFGDQAGLLYTANSAEGRILQTHMFRDGFSTSPPIADGRTLILASGRYVIATPLIHYWGVRTQRIPELTMPEDNATP